MISFKKAEGIADHMEVEDFIPEEEEESPQQSIADVDSKEFVEALNKYFDSVNKNTVTHDEATDVLLIIYSESTLEDIKTFEEKLLNDVELDENEENLLYFKKHIDQYLEDFHKGEDLSREALLDIVENNLMLKYLEEKMLEEEANENLEDEEDLEDNDDVFDTDKLTEDA